MDDSDLYANRPPRKKRIQKTQPVMKADPIQPEITGALFDKRIGDLLLYTAVFTGGCLLTLVVMTIFLIEIS